MMAAVPSLRPAYPVRTARLLLRPLTAADAGALAAYRGLPEVCRYVPFEPMSPEVITARLAGDWSATALSAEGESLTLGAELAATGQLIGDLVLFFTSAEHRGGEIGWVFHPGHGGRGYATEAAHAMLHLAFGGLRLHRVVARLDARNDASARLAARLGMRQEAYLVRNEWFKGEWTDEIGCAVLADEWAAAHPAGLAGCRWPGAPGEPGPAQPA